MDLEQKRGSTIAKEDRISNLPTEIIHHILSFLDMKNAVQTSMLSRKWKHIWTSMPHLNLNCRTFPTLLRFVNFVKNDLSRRNNQTKVSTANFNLTEKATQFIVKSIINYVYSHNVKQLTVTWFTTKTFEFPRILFGSQTLKHLIVATIKFSTWDGPFGQLPKSAWDFPALETVNLRNLQVGDSNLFSKCAKLKDLTLHRCCMYDLDIFNVYAPQLSDLTITHPVAFPKVFNLVAPRLKNLTASICILDARHLKDVDIHAHKKTQDFDFLQLSSERLDSLEKVNLSFSVPAYAKKTDVLRLLNLFQKLRSVKFLILNVNIIEALSSCLDQLAHEPCPFNRLKSLKIDALPLKPKDLTFQVINYLLERSPSATFNMDLP